MNSLIIVLVCVVLAVLIQFLLCRSDNILMGLIIPAVFALIAIMMSVVTKGNGLNKFTDFEIGRASCRERVCQYG